MFSFNLLIISPRSFFVSFYVNWSVPKKTAVLHKEDEPGDLPVKLTGSGVTVAEFGLTCASFSGGGGGKPRFFPMKVLLIVVSQTDLLKSSS